MFSGLVNPMTMTKKTKSGSKQTKQQQQKKDVESQVPGSKLRVMDPWDGPLVEAFPIACVMYLFALSIFAFMEICQKKLFSPSEWVTLFAVALGAGLFGYITAFLVRHLCSPGTMAADDNNSNSNKKKTISVKCIAAYLFVVVYNLAMFSHFYQKYNENDLLSLFQERYASTLPPTIDIRIVLHWQILMVFTLTSCSAVVFYHFISFFKRWQLSRLQ